MNEPIDPASKADAARAREVAARKKSQKSTIIFGVAMFGIVFALLSFKYVTGSDPSLRTDSLSAQREAVPSQTVDPQGQWQGDEDQWQGGDDGGDDGWQQQQSAPQDQSQSGAPSTGAS